jgi:hypothetical protein
MYSDQQKSRNQIKSATSSFVLSKRISIMDQPLLFTFWLMDSMNLSDRISVFAQQYDKVLTATTTKIVIFIFSAI